jgi:O-antigen/teichoic acid export membrane protein
MSEGSTPTENSESILIKYAHKFHRYIKDPLYQNSLFLMASTAVNSALGFVFLIIITNLYSDDDVGLANAILSGINLITLFSLLGLDALLIRYLPRSERQNDLVNFSFSLSAITSLIIAGIFVLGIHTWSPALNFIRDNPKFAACFIIFVVFLTLSVMMNTLFIAKRKAYFAFTKDTVSSVLKIPLVFILLALSFRAFGIVGSWGISIVIAVIVAGLIFLPRVQSGYIAKLNLNFKIVKGLWHYSIGSYFISILSTMPVLILPIIIINRSGGAENAYYYTAWTLACLLFIIPGSVSQSLFAEGSHFEDKLDANVRRSYKLIFLLLIPLIILFVFAGKWLLLAFGKNYSEGGMILLQIFSISAILYAINNVYYTILRVKNKLAELIALYGFSTLSILIGSYFILPRTGLVGIGYIWFSVQAIVSIYVTAKMVMLHKRRA